MEIITLLASMIDDACNLADQFDTWQEDAETTIMACKREGAIIDVFRTLADDEGGTDFEILIRKDDKNRSIIDSIRYTNSDGDKITEIVASKIKNHIETQYLTELYYTMCETVARYSTVAW